MPFPIHARSRASIWGVAIVLASLGTLTLWGATDPGVNWGLWMTGAIAALLVATYRRFRRVSVPTAVAGAWAIALSFGLAVTADQRVIVVLVLMSLVLLAIALLTVEAISLDALVPPMAILAPLNAIRTVVRGAAAEVLGTGSQLKARETRPAIRGVLITLPIVVILVAVLANADPLFAWLRDHVTALFPDIFSARMLFFMTLLVVTLGAYSAVARDLVPRPTAIPPVRMVFGGTERRVLLWAVTTIVWLFVASSIVSLWADPAARAGTGITYADYARRGFGELAIASTVVIGVVLIASRFGARDDRAARVLSLAALAAVGAMLGIAFTRVLRYEWAYGYTASRMQAQGYMLVLAGALVILALEVGERTAPKRFAYRVATCALVVIVASVYWNTDAWIANRNIDRYIASGKLDVAYLTWGLSADAIPTVVRRRGVLGGAERDAVEAWLRCDVRRELRPDPRWFEWNVRAIRALEAARPLLAQHGCPPPSRSVAD